MVESYGEAIEITNKKLGLLTQCTAQLKCSVLQDTIAARNLHVFKKQLEKSMGKSMSTIIKWKTSGSGSCWTEERWKLGGYNSCWSLPHLLEIATDSSFPSDFCHFEMKVWKSVQIRAGPKSLSMGKIKLAHFSFHHHRAHESTLHWVFKNSNIKPTSKADSNLTKDIWLHHV